MTASAAPITTTTTPTTKTVLVQDGDDDDVDNKEEGTKESYPWVLPSGAESIIRQMAAERILQLSLDHCYSDGNHQKVDFDLISSVIREFPGAAKIWYEFQIDTRDAATKVRQLLPLHMLVCLKPPLDVVQDMLNAYPEAISMADPAKGATPLLYACSFEASYPVVEFLVRQYPAAVHQQRHDGAIPLAMACSYQATLEVVELLIQKYPQGISQASLDGWYPIHAAIACQAHCVAIQRLFQAFPESITSQDNVTRSTALHLATSKRASYEVVEWLLRLAPETVLWPDSKRMTPWFWAWYTQTVPVLQLFLQWNNNNNNNDNEQHALPQHSADGISLLHFAARHNTADVVAFCCRQYPALTLSRTRSAAMTPLHTACRRRRSLDVIQTLIQHNPRALLCRNQRGKVPLEEAKEAKMPQPILDYLTQQQQIQIQTQQKQQQQQQSSSRRGWLW